MFKTDAREIIEDVMMSAFRPGMTAGEFAKGAAVELSGILPDGVAGRYTLENARPDDQPGSVVIDVVRR